MHLVTVTAHGRMAGNMSDIEISQYPGTIPEPDLTDVEVIARFAQNTAGRDFVVGDVHGMFGHLTSLLREIDFCDSRTGYSRWATWLTAGRARVRR